MLARRFPLVLSLLASALALGGAHADAGAPTKSATPVFRWTDETPDAMIDDARARALGPNATATEQLAAIATIFSLASRASAEHAENALASFAREGHGATLASDVRDDASLLARMLAGDDGTDAGAARDEELGVVDALSILGPFRDTGGGLDAHDGPEGQGQSFADPHARYSWGSYDVAWRPVPRAFAAAAGAPLDVFVFPRKESCTWLATKLTVLHPQKLAIRLASSGQARLVFDGVDLAEDQAVHEAARFDRLAASVDAAAGPHILAAKVCSGALDDDGRVRLRVTDDAGARPPGVVASADLSSVPRRTSHSPKLRFDRRTPPLAGALASTPRGSDAELDVAILRTLGGADDLRSPRAPGMLASLAGGPLDADRLAMAAFITPSGANRSAWLFRARGSADSDDRTRAFVDRRLVERHLEAGLSDWAMATLRGAKIDTSPDAEATLLASQVELALGTDALRVSALRRLSSAAAAKSDAPDALLEELAEIGTSLDPKAVTEARERLAARGTVDSAWVNSLGLRGETFLIAAARRAFAGGIDSADEGLAVAEAVAGTGAHAEALRFYEELTRWSPNRAAAWSGLAHQASAAPLDTRRDETIAAALRRTRELEPSEVRYRDELALRARPGSGEAHDDEKYLVRAETILARRQGARAKIASSPGGDSQRPDPAAKSVTLAAVTDGERPPDVADRELHWLRAVVMHPDRRVSELVHYAREIVIPPRTEEELYEDIPAEGDLTEVVRARVYRRDGGTAFPVEETSDSAHPRIRWPELAAGDVVEVAFRSWTAGPVGGRGDPPFYRLDYAGALSTHPVLYNEVNVESPSDRPIHVDVVNGHPDRREEKDVGGTHIVRLVWEKPANVADEPLAPPLSEVIPTVVLSTFRDWAAFRAWYSEAVRGFTEPDAQVRELAAKLTAGKTSREAKLQALFDFVADDIRYVNYVSGEWWLPNRPQQLLARREGDCDDKALLLITLLKCVGIDAQEVLVQTRMTSQPSILRAPGAAIPLFDHGIAFLPGPSGGTYLDATSPQSRLGPLPSMDARAVGLRLDGPAAIVDLPSSSPSDHGVDATWSIALHANGSADLQGEERATGDDAFWMRTYLTEPGARSSWVEEHLVGGLFSTVEVDKKVDFQGDVSRGAAVVNWRGRSSGLARHEGDELVMALSPAQTLASQIAPLVTRTLPVWLPPYVAPRKDSRTLRIVAPKGWSFEALPPGGDENEGAFGRAHIDVSRDPHDPQAIFVKRAVVFDKSTIGVEDYPRWRAWVQRVDALMHRSVRLLPTAGAPR